MENAVTKMEPEHRVNVPVPVTPMQMLQTAVEQGADLDKLQKLMDLQERWEANEARKAFVAARAAFRAEAPTIGKGKHVHFRSKNGGADTDYWHATLDSVVDSIGPVMGKHGLSHSWRTEQLDGGRIRVTCILTHAMGHSEEISLESGPDQSGNKNNIQAVGSTITYLERYTLLAITGTATKDQDDDGASGGNPAMLINGAEKDKIIALMKEGDVDTAAFLKYLGVASLDELPVSRFENAVDALNIKIRKKKEAK